MAAVKLRALKDDKEIESIPLSEPVLVQLDPPNTGVVSSEPDEKKVDVATGEDAGVKALKEQLTASEAARVTAERQAQESSRLAAEREREATQLRSENEASQTGLISSSLAAAQAESSNAEAEYVAAFNAGDALAMAKAQSKIARAAAKIVEYEGAAAVMAERKEAPKPAGQERVAYTDPVAAIKSNPGLMQPEKDWLTQHQDAWVDPRRNQELAVGYDRAIRQGLVRGTPEYFKFLDGFMGYAKADDPVKTDEDDGETIVAAPVSREATNINGTRLTDSQVVLTPEQRDLARGMFPNKPDGQAERLYAQQVLKLRQDKKENPDRYAGRQ